LLFEKNFDIIIISKEKSKGAEIFGRLCKNISKRD
jgi:ribosomal protein L14